VDVITGAGYFRSSIEQRHEVVAQKAKRHGRSIGRADESQGKVPAYVNHGRWVADCPDCNGAELVTPNEPMMCDACFNEGNGGAYRAVVFPRSQREIEAQLAIRPEPEHRNWAPGETVAQLRAENAEHGIEAN
jgi:hypothetical protein